MFARGAARRSHRGPLLRISLDGHRWEMKPWLSFAAGTARVCEDVSATGGAYLARRDVDTQKLLLWRLSPNWGAGVPCGSLQSKACAELLLQHARIVERPLLSAVGANVTCSCR